MQTVEFDAPAVGRTLKYNIILPAGYEGSQERYPTLYLLHGLTSNYTAWSRMRVPEYAASYDMIVVMPDAGNSWYVNFARSDEGEQNAWEDYMIEDLIGHVDANFRTIARREGRAINGLSMGGFAALHFGLNHPDLARSLVVSGCGYGAEPDRREQFCKEAEATAQRLEADDMEAFAKIYAIGPTRVQFQNKDPRGWREFADMLGAHSATGSALTQRGVQRERPSLWDLEDAMRKLSVPTLIVTGDEDEPCLVPGIFMKRTIPSSGLVVIPKTGHAVNLEEPDAFNRILAEFLDLVEAGRWDQRDPRSVTETILGAR